MAGVFQLRPEHVAALEDAGVGGCAECQRLTAGAHRRPAAVAPGTYVLRFHEFVNYAAVRDVWGAGAALVPARWRNVEGTSTVYIFRRLGGRTTLWQALAGGGTYTLVVRPEEAGATYYACLSRFALPPERIRQYTAPNAQELLSARCVALDLGDQRVVRAAGGRTYDVVLCDYRRIVTELQGYEETERRQLDQALADGGQAQERLLAQLTIQAAVGHAAHNPKVLGWLRPAERPARFARRPRPPALAGRAYTSVELALALADERAERARLPLEARARDKYRWMRRAAYREMCYDALRSPADQRATVLAEAALLDRALETDAGRAFVSGHAASDGSWYVRYLRAPLAYEVNDVRSAVEVADAFWTLLGVVGPARIANVRVGDDSGRGPDKQVDLAKQVAGGGDAAAKERLKQPGARAEAARAEAADAVRERRRASALAHEARDAAQGVEAEVEALLRTRWREVEQFHVAAVGHYTGLALGVAAYDGGLGRWQTVRQVTEYQVARTPELDAWVAAWRGRATAAEWQAGEALAREVHASVGVLDARALEVRAAHAAWWTTRGVQALAAINLALALAAAKDDPRPATRVKVAGAIADLVFTLEFAFDRALSGVKAGAAGRAVAGAAEVEVTATGTAAVVQTAASRLAAVRAAGAVGGIISTWASFSDSRASYNHADNDLGSAYAISAVGGATLTFAALSGLTDAAGQAGLGTAFGELLPACFGATWWTGVGLLLSIVGAGAVILLAKPPIEAWIRECEWGTERDASKSITAQLESLMQLLASPGVAVHALGPGDPVPAGVPRAPYMLVVSVAPMVLYPDETRVALDLDIVPVQLPHVTLPGAPVAPQRWRSPFLVDRALEFGPVRAGLVARATLEETVLGTERALRPGARSPAERSATFTLDERGGAPVFRAYVPLSEPVPGDPADLERGFLGYGFGGSSRVQLWTRSRYGGAAPALRPYSVAGLLS